jgi:heme-degrading monooxygenase HmoA
MFARVSTLQGSSDGVDDSTRQVEEQVIPAARDIKGYKGLLALGDRGTGKVVAITFWEDEETMRASEEVANRLREDAAQAAGEQIVSVERFEVLVDKR